MNAPPFYKLTKTELLKELQSTNKYIQAKLTDMNFTKFIQAQTPQSNILTNKCRYHDIEDIQLFLNNEKGMCKTTSIGKTHTNIVHFHIRPLDRHFGELTAFNTQTNNVFDYIALSEIGTKNIEARKELLNTMGYQLHYKLSHLSKGGVGLITDKEKDIKIRPEFVFKNTKYNKVNLTTESLWLERVFNDEKHNFILGVIY